MKAAIYIRVSTGKQDLGAQTQFAACAEEVEKRGWTPYQTYEDIGVSGTNPDKPSLKDAIRDAAMKRYTVLVVFNMDRLTRQGIKPLMDLLDKLENQYKVQVISVTEPYLSSDQPNVELVRAVLAWVAKKEAEKISAKTKEGMARAKKQGKQIGRPRERPGGSRTTRWRERKQMESAAVSKGGV